MLTFDLKKSKFDFDFKWSNDCIILGLKLVEKSNIFLDNPTNVY